MYCAIITFFEYGEIMNIEKELFGKMKMVKRYINIM